MTQLKQCPVEGCDFSGSISQVQGHFGKTKDAGHGGSFPGAEDAGPEPTQLNPNQHMTDTDTSTTTTTTTTNPTMPTGDPTDTGTDTAGKGETLPCGHESINPNDAPEPPFNVTCETCGESYGVKK